MNKKDKISAAVQEAEAQLRAIEDLIETILRENKPENAELIAAMSEDIKKRNTFH